MKFLKNLQLFIIALLVFNIFNVNNVLAYPIKSYQIATVKEVSDRGEKASTSKGSINVLKTDTSGSQKIVTGYIAAFGGVLIAIALILVAFKMIINAKKPDSRTEGIEAIGKIAAGAVILGSACLIAGLLASFTSNMGVDLSQNTKDISNNVTTLQDKDGNFLIRALAGVIEDIPASITELVGKVAGFKPLDDLIFKDSSPFSSQEWNNLMYLYVAVCSIIGPLILIMIGKTGFKYIYSTTSVSNRVDLKEEIMHWLFSCFIIATAPLFIQGLFTFCKGMLDALSSAVPIFKSPKDSAFSNLGMISSLQTGHLLTTAIVKFLYVWKYLEINLIFLSRKIVLSVMIAFTPIAAALWGIEKKVNAFPIWFGEMISNATMQFFYAFTFIVMIVSLGSGNITNWFYGLIWMFAIVKIAEMLRNSLQGLFARLSGIDESSMGGRAFGAIGGTMAGMTAAFGSTFGGGGFKGSNVGQKVFGETIAKMNKNRGNTNIGDSAKNIGGIKPGTSVNASANGANANSRSMSGTKINNGSMSGTNIDNRNTGSMGNKTPIYGADGSTILNGGSSNTEEAGTPIYNSDANNEKQEDPQVEALKESSNNQNLYNSMLGDNMNRRMAEKNNKVGRTLGNVARAATGFSPEFEGFARGIENVTGKIQNRKATGKAINDTTSQMMDLNQGNMTKEEALSTLFGSSTDLQSNFKHMKFLNKPVDSIRNSKFAKHQRDPQHRFEKNIANGNLDKAASILSENHPLQKTDPELKSKIIVQMNPYTSMDGFRW